jgi:hypothetical protein
MNISKIELAEIIAATVAALRADEADRAVRQSQPQRGSVPDPKELRAAHLLSNHAATNAAIKAEKPHLKYPSWMLEGRAVTCVWPLIDCIGGSEKTRKKVVSAMKAEMMGHMTLAHRAHSDNGPVPIRKVGAESYYAAIDDVLATYERVCPRMGKKAVAAFKARYA